MNTITPLMRAIMEALDRADGGMTSEQIERAVWASFNGFDDVKAVESALFGLAFDELVSESATVRRDVYTQVFALTDAGCDALWALQKGDVVSASFVGIDTASGPDKGVLVTFADGSFIECTDTNYAPLKQVVRDNDAHNPARDGDLVWKPGEPRTNDGVRPVRFNSRDELRAYTSGAKA